MRIYARLAKWSRREDATMPSRSLRIADMIIEISARPLGFLSGESSGFEIAGEIVGPPVPISPDTVSDANALSRS